MNHSLAFILLVIALFKSQVGRCWNMIFIEFAIANGKSIF